MKNQLLVLENFETPNVLNQLEVLKEALVNTLIPDNVEEIVAFTKRLDTIKKEIKAQRDIYFKDLDQNKKSIIALEKDIEAKSKEAKEIKLKLEEEERLIKEDKHQKVLVLQARSVISEKAIAEFRLVLNNFIKEKQTYATILTKSSYELANDDYINMKLTKKYADEIIAFCEKLNTAIEILDIHGLKEFHKNGCVDLNAAIAYQNEVKEANELQKQKDEEARIQEEARLKALEIVKSERVEEQTELIRNNVEEQIENEKPEFEELETIHTDYEEIEESSVVIVNETTPIINENAPQELVATLVITYTEEKKGALNDLIINARALGVKVEIKK